MKTARLSFIALAATLFFTSIRHLYRFGAVALLFNAVTIVLALLLFWYLSRRSSIAGGLYALVGAWIVAGFGIVDSLWDGVVKLYVAYFFPGVTIFRRSPPRPFGFEAAAILTAVASLFALYYGVRFLRSIAWRGGPLLLTAPLLVLIGGSAYGIAQKTAKHDDGVVRIGVIVPTHGPQRPLGRAFVRAVELARDDRMTKRPYELVIADSGTTPGEARTAIERLIYRDNVQAIVGGISRSGQIVAPYATAERIPHMCVCSVATIGDGVYNFTNIPLPEDEAVRWMEEAQRRGIRRVAIVAQKYSSIDGHVNALTREAERRNISIVYVNRFDATTADFRPIIEAARRAGPDIYVISGFNPGLDILGAQLKAAGIRDVSAVVALAVSEKKDLYDGAWYTDSFVDDRLRARFEAKFPDTPFVAHMIPYAYDSFNILADGFESGQDVASYVRNVTRYRGAAGVIVRTLGGGNFRSRPAVWVIANGKARIEED
jgi:ABC-type branched-subunit amino acid transport system substrate-binding protein